MNIQRIQRVNSIIRLHMELNKEFHKATYHKVHLKEKQQKESRAGKGFRPRVRTSVKYLHLRRYHMYIGMFILIFILLFLFLLFLIS
jgi:hypothetical protein